MAGRRAGDAGDPTCPVSCGIHVDPTRIEGGAHLEPGEQRLGGVVTGSS